MPNELGANPGALLGFGPPVVGWRRLGEPQLEDARRRLRCRVAPQHRRRALVNETWGVREAWQGFYGRRTGNLKNRRGVGGRAQPVLALIPRMSGSREYQTPRVERRGRRRSTALRSTLL